MIIWWCEEHDAWIESSGDDCVLSLQGRLGRCRQVSMRLTRASVNWNEHMQTRMVDPEDVS